MADAEFIVTLKVTWPIHEGDDWIDPVQWNWRNAVVGITGRKGTTAEIMQISPTRFEDEEDKNRMWEPGVKHREEWELGRAGRDE